jgi:hypothetical protein
MQLHSRWDNRLYPSLCVAINKPLKDRIADLAEIHHQRFGKQLKILGIAEIAWLTDFPGQCTTLVNARFLPIFVPSFNPLYPPWLYPTTLELHWLLLKLGQKTSPITLNMQESTN